MGHWAAGRGLSKGRRCQQGWRSGMSGGFPLRTFTQILSQTSPFAKVLALQESVVRQGRPATPKGAMHT